MVRLRNTDTITGTSIKKQKPRIQGEAISHPARLSRRLLAISLLFGLLLDTFLPPIVRITKGAPLNFV